LREDREEDRSQNGDDRDDHQELDQSEGTPHVLIIAEGFVKR
jgi:hypothetical protein